MLFCLIKTFCSEFNLIINANELTNPKTWSILYTSKLERTNGVNSKSGWHKCISQFSLVLFYFAQSQVLQFFLFVFRCFKFSNNSISKTLEINRRSEFANVNHGTFVHYWKCTHVRIQTEIKPKLIRKPQYALLTK